MPSVKYVGPFDEVEVEGQVVKHGQTVDFDPDTAGRAPSGSPLNKDGSPSKSYDPGVGLLAQADNWQPGKKGDA